MAILKTIDVSKRYADHLALDKVSIEVNQGEVFGLLGPNGAGKTTLIRMINQITAPDEGEILFCDRRMRSEDTKQIGYLPEERGLYKKMRVYEQALYLAELKGMKPSEAKKQLAFWFDKFGISSWSNKKLEELSKGMAQKIQFITTIIHRPKLLIFDEPFSGFDPVNANLLKNEILSLRDEGATVIFSTHNMSSVEEICDRIVLIDKSRKILEGRVEDIKRTFGEDLFEIIIPENHNAESLIPDYCTLEENIQKEGRSILRLKIPKGRNSEFISSIMQQTELLSYREALPSMNDIFIKTVNRQ